MPLNAVCPSVPPPPEFFYWWPIATLGTGAFLAAHLGGIARRHRRTLGTHVGILAGILLVLAFAFVPLSRAAVVVGCTDTGGAYKFELDFLVPLGSLLALATLWAPYIVAGASPLRAAMWTFIVGALAGISGYLDYGFSQLSIETYCNGRQDWLYIQWSVAVISAVLSFLITTRQMRRQPFSSVRLDTTSWYSDRGVGG